MTNDWKEKLQGMAPEKIASTVKMCPKCHELALVYDVKTSRIYCNKCGFEEHLSIGGMKQ